MSVCTFFGHKDTPEETKSILRSALIYLIEKQNVDLFYVGNNGNFDSMVAKSLSELQNIYSHIKFFVVIAYLPTHSESYISKCIYKTIYPQGLENIPKRFAIDKRNRWMLNNSSFVITYVNRITGGAYKFKCLAQKQNKTVIELTDKKLPI